MNAEDRTLGILELLKRVTSYEAALRRERARHVPSPNGMYSVLMCESCSHEWPCESKVDIDAVLPSKATDFYEEDEPVEDIKAAFEQGEKGITTPDFRTREDGTYELIDRKEATNDEGF